MNVNQTTLLLNHRYIVNYNNKMYEATYIGWNICNDISAHMFQKPDNTIIMIPVINYQYAYYYAN